LGSFPLHVILASSDCLQVTGKGSGGRQGNRRRQTEAMGSRRREQKPFASFADPTPGYKCHEVIVERRGVSKGVEDSRRPPNLQANQPFQGWPTPEGLGMAGQGGTLVRPWPPIAIRP
jgi:hypothetical protein